MKLMKLTQYYTGKSVFIHPDECRQVDGNYSGSSNCTAISMSKDCLLIVAQTPEEVAIEFERVTSQW